jgi:hypothetical protein
LASCNGSGATLDELVAATNWLPHTTRAALTGLRRRGHEITCTREAGQRGTYRIVRPAKPAVDAGGR